MTRTMFALALVLTLAGPGVSSAADEARVQGLYDGKCRDAQGEHEVEARVVAWGKGEYRIYLRRSLAGGEIAKLELKGRTEGQTIVFSGEEQGAKWTATYAEGLIKGRCGPDGALEIRRVQRTPPSMGEQQPPDAVVLLDGTSFKEMARRGGQKWYVDDMSRDGWGVWEAPIRTIAPKEPRVWPTVETLIPEGWALATDRRRADTVIGIGEDGSMRIPRGGMNSRRRFKGSLDLHVEFMCPLRPTQRSQGRGNSGVYLPCGTEIQVLDSFGMTTYLGGGCGGLYKWKDPDTMEIIDSLKNTKENRFNAASLPPLEWQTYDVEYRVRPDQSAQSAAFLTVLHNGIKIHDNVKLRKKPRQGTFHFQDHGNPVRYRNIWVLPVSTK